MEKDNVKFDAHNLIGKLEIINTLGRNLLGMKNLSVDIPVEMLLFYENQCAANEFMIPMYSDSISRMGMEDNLVVSDFKIIKDNVLKLKDLY